MSHDYRKVETVFQEGWSAEEKFKFVLHRNNSCDYVSVFQNGECLFSFPDDVFHKFLTLLNDNAADHGKDIQPVTIEDLVEAGLRKA